MPDSFAGVQGSRVILIEIWQQKYTIIFFVYFFHKKVLKTTLPLTLKFQYIFHKIAREHDLKLGNPSKLRGKLAL